MRIGICRGMARFAGDVDAQYAYLKKLGFDTTDESLCETERPYYASVAAMEEHCKPIREASEKYGIKVFQVHASFGLWHKKETWEETYSGILEILRLGLYGAHLMGAENYVLHPLFEYGIWVERVYFNSDEAREHTIQCIRDLIPDAEKYGITLCLENLPGNNREFFLTKEIAKAVEEINSPYVGICLDTGHAAVNGEDLGDAVRNCGKHLRCLHTHDNDGELDQHNLPFFGVIDWGNFTTALAETGYSGSISLEASPYKSRHLTPALREKMEELCLTIVHHLADEVEEKKSTVSE
ncbi:MAG: sugar phosphate isomerase/epimerase [Clostridia bacterium]|nr:sugar phosphate isomerase/epimerase [Clostridia bacterium]